MNWIFYANDVHFCTWQFVQYCAARTVFAKTNSCTDFENTHSEYCSLSRFSLSKQTGEDLTLENELVLIEQSHIWRQKNDNATFPAPPIKEELSQFSFLGLQIGAYFMHFKTKCGEKTGKGNVPQHTCLFVSPLSTDMSNKSHCHNLFWWFMVTSHWLVGQHSIKELWLAPYTFLCAFKASERQF